MGDIFANWIIFYKKLTNRAKFAFFLVMFQIDFYFSLKFYEMFLFWIKHFKILLLLYFSMP